jgi:hypothetical protein
MCHLRSKTSFDIPDVSHCVQNLNLNAVVSIEDNLFKERCIHIESFFLLSSLVSLYSHTFSITPDDMKS